MEEPIDYTFQPAEAEQIRRCVEEAFADVPYPGDDHITLYPCPCSECNDTREWFGGKHWREMVASDEPFQYAYWGGLAIMTPEARRFYLPAYLMVSLGTDAAAGNALEKVQFNLSPERAWPDTPGFFSAAQQECFAAYARAASTDPDDEEWKDEKWQAIADYWQGKAAEAKANS